MTTRSRIAVTLLLLAAACGGPEPAVGVLLPRSGRTQAAGDQALAGIALALETLPEDARPRLVVADDGGTALATTAAYDVLVDEGAQVVIGPLDTGCALAAAVVARRRRVPFVSPSATGEEVTRNNTFAFRICAGDAEMARKLATHAAYDLRLQHVVVVVDLSDRHALGFAESFAHEFVVRRGRIVAELPFHPGDEDVPGLLDRAAERLRRSAEEGRPVPDDRRGVLVMASHDDVLAMVRGARSPAVADLVLLGGADWEGPELEAALAGRFRGAWRVSHFHPDEGAPDATRGPDVSTFLDAWSRRHDEPPSDIAALAYDATLAVLPQLADAADGAELADRLRELAFLGGVTGRVHMDASGRPRNKSFVLEQLHDPRRSAFFERSGE